MKKTTKAISLALSTAIAASSFAALAAMAYAQDNTVSFGEEKTFDAVRLTYDSAPANDETVTINGQSYAIEKGTTTTVVNVTEDTTASELAVTNSSNAKIAIELLDYEKIELNTTATAPYMNYSYFDSADYDASKYGSNERGDASAARYTNMFNGIPDMDDENFNPNANLAALYKPNSDGTAASDATYALNFDLGSETEIAKMRLYTAYSTVLTGGYIIGTISDAKATEADNVITTVTKSAYDSNATSYKVNVCKYLDTVINTKTDRLQVKFFGNDTTSTILVSIYELELYTYSTVASYTVGAVQEEKTTKSQIYNEEGSAAAISFYTDNINISGDTSERKFTWVISQTGNAGKAHVTSASLPNVESGLKLGLIITGAEKELETIDEVTLTIE